METGARGFEADKQGRSDPSLGAPALDTSARARGQTTPQARDIPSSVFWSSAALMSYSSLPRRPIAFFCSAVYLSLPTARATPRRATLGLRPVRTPARTATPTKPVAACSDTSATSSTRPGWVGMVESVRVAVDSLVSARAGV